jgi:hypothetical protein
MYKYQEQFSEELTQKWLAGDREHVRLKIRQCKDRAQAAYIAASIAMNLGSSAALSFVEFIHPNNQ